MRLDEVLQQGSVASLGVGASRRAEQRDRLAACDPMRQARDGLPLPDHLGEVAPTVLRPGDRRSVLPVVLRVEYPARPELREPRFPGLVVLAHAAWSVPAHEKT